MAGVHMDNIWHSMGCCNCLPDGAWADFDPYTNIFNFDRWGNINIGRIGKKQAIDYWRDHFFRICNSNFFCF